MSTKKYYSRTCFERAKEKITNHTLKFQREPKRVWGHDWQIKTNDQRLA